MYCQHCGADLEHTTSLVATNTLLPAVLQRPLQRTVAASVGALALGIGIELLRRGWLAHLARSSAPVAGGILPALSRMLPARPHEKVSRRAKKGYEMQEVVYIRRTVRF
jgi:hypothetical protein